MDDTWLNCCFLLGAFNVHRNLRNCVSWPYDLYSVKAGHVMPWWTSRLLVVLEKNEFFHCEALLVYKDYGEILERSPWPQSYSQLGQILTENGPFLQTDPERRESLPSSWMISRFLASWYTNSFLELQKKNKNCSVLVRFGRCQHAMNSLQSESLVRTAKPLC